MNYWVISLIACASAIVCYYLSFKKKKQGPWAVDVGEHASAKETKPKRSALFADKLLGTARECTTLYESWVGAAEKYGDAECLGSRQIVKVFTESKVVDGVEKKWNFYQKGPYTFKTYSQVNKVVHEFASGLRAINLKPKDNLAIYCGTSEEWTIAEQACYSQSIVVLTVYANLGLDGLKYALQQAEITHILTEGRLLPQLAKIFADCPSIQYIVTCQQKPDTEVINQMQNINHFTFEDVIERGKDQPVAPVAPTPEDLACIMYTSGSTGHPKGVMIAHSSMMAAVAGYGNVIAVSNETYLNYLPLAHVLAMVIENACLHFGCKMGFGNPLTLTDTNMRGSKGDIRELRPTAFAGVPMVYDKIKAGIVAKVSSASAFTQALFWTSVRIKKFYCLYGRSTPILDAIVFSKFTDLLGGRMKWMVSGGAPLSADAHLFLKACFSIPILQGYGLTETCGAGAVMNLKDISLGTVGPPVPCVEIKLVSVETMGYTINDKPLPRGEVWMRGPCITNGYFKNAEKTKEAFRDGWFLTGDIGCWSGTGSLKIIDRKKNLIKGPHGEYIALEKLESIYKNSAYVQNICVYADSNLPFNIAIIQPQLPTLQRWAATTKQSSTDVGVWCKDPALEKEVLKDLVTTGRNSGLKSFEMIKSIIITPEEWTPDNGMLTAAMKLNRRAIYKTFDKEMQELKNK